MTPGELVARHARIALDANVFIYLLEDDPARRDVVGELLDALAGSGRRACFASIGLAEVLAGPVRRGDPATVERIADEIRALECVTVEPLTAEVAVDAAVIRGRRSITLDDAIHLATARAAGSTAFVTNDRRLRSAPNLAVVYLDRLSREGQG